MHFDNWSPSPDRRDPLEIVRQDEMGRDSSLLALRHERMSADAFAFYRGTASIMAADLATIEVSGIKAQLCGDAHVMNFGGYATPERNLIFDVNDFDETRRGPWEWDLARLCASLPLFAESRKFKAGVGDDAARGAACAYRKMMRRLAKRSPLDVWYSRIDVRGKLRKELAPPQTATHVKAPDHVDILTRHVYRQYVASLLPHVRVLLDRYTPIGIYEHPVGVGSLGLFAGIVELEARPNEMLYLQVKEARASVLEPWLGPSQFKNHAERVVYGQHVMQAASDLFLGWLRDGSKDYYVRQLRDHKTSLDALRVSPVQFKDYARRCGEVLARAHARTGAADEIAEAIGRGSLFDEAMARFARVYATVVQSDYEAFCKAM